MKRRLIPTRPRHLLIAAVVCLIGILGVAAASASLEGLPLDLADQREAPARAVAAKAVTTNPGLAAGQNPPVLSPGAGPGLSPGRPVTATALPADPTLADSLAGIRPVTATITVSGTARTYETFEPPATAVAGGTKVPALVVLHGSRVPVRAEESRDGLVQLAARGKALVVYPVGFHQSWNAGACCGPAKAAGINDLGFLSSLLRQVATDPRVSRVYLVGYSNGGRMAYDLVCTQPTLVSAFVVVSAVAVAGCPPGPPVSLLEMVGNLDPILSYDASVPRHVINGYQEPTVAEQIGFWRHHDGCSPQSVKATAGTLHLETWNHCSGGSVVELGTYMGAGHLWPAGNGSTPSGADVLWGFLTNPHPAQAAPQHSPSPQLSPSPHLLPAPAVPLLH